jgi:hypothetical protein
MCLSDLETIRRRDEAGGCPTRSKNAGDVIAQIDTDSVKVIEIIHRDL